MKNRERIVWIIVVLVLLMLTTASGLNNWIFAGDAEKAYQGLRLFNEVFNLLRTEYYDESKVTPNNLIEGAIEGMIATLDDPHTSYLTKEMFDELQTDTRGEFGGLGIVIGIRDNRITVISPIDDTPAARVGIKAGDKIIRIDGESTEGFTTLDAVKRLRGEVGSSVTITVERKTETQPLEFTIIRGIIKIETVKSTVIDNHTGYIRISQFSEPTAETMQNHINTLLEKNVDSMIVDLRNNPGGLLSTVIEITDMFLSKGVIVSTKGRELSQNRTFFAHEKTLVPELPLIVLVNEGSASASEIFAGCIKDNKRGILVGETTFGKGSVQSVRELPDGPGIRITTALYYTPSGNSIDSSGIDPDEVVAAVDLTLEETKAIDKARELDLVKNFVKDHPAYTDAEFNHFMSQLSDKGIELRPIIVRRLIKNELEKDRMPDLIDLDYDVQLKHAVNMLKTLKPLLKTTAS